MQALCCPPYECSGEPNVLAAVVRLLLGCLELLWPCEDDEHQKYKLRLVLGNFYSSQLGKLDLTRWEARARVPTDRV